jgi:hypothetical protein
MERLIEVCVGERALPETAMSSETNGEVQKQGGAAAVDLILRELVRGKRVKTENERDCVKLVTDSE